MSWVCMVCGETNEEDKCKECGISKEDSEALGKQETFERDKKRYHGFKRGFRRKYKA